jgi:hypothetical protein
MKAFAIRSVGFLLIAFLFLIVLDLLLDKCIVQHKKFSLKPGKEYIVVGHSIPECSINDSLIRNVQNVSGSMEGYLYTYYKTKILIESNPQLKGVFIEYTNCQVNAWSTNRLYGDYLPYLLPKYSPVIDNEGLVYLFKKNPAGSFRAIHSSLKKKMLYLVSNKSDFITAAEWGGYHSVTGCLTQQQVDSFCLIEKKFQNDKLNICDDNLYYLQKTINLCKEKDLKVYLLRSPMPSYLPYKLEEDLQASLREEFKGITFLDFKDFPLGRKDFLDNQHLNSQGARKFSLVFNDLLEAGIFDRPDAAELVKASYRNIPGTF